MDWRQLEWQTFHGKTSQERIEARKLCDAERCRLYNYDRANGTKELLAWTIHVREGFEMPDVEIDEGVAPPADVAAPKKRGRKAGTKNTPPQSQGLADAIAFVSPVQSDLFENSHFVSLAGHMAVAYNGQMAAGHPIREELTVSAHIDKLAAALSKCGKSLTITETEAMRLSIKGDKLRALVPCLAEPLAPMFPDPAGVTGDFDSLKESFKVVGTMASEDGEKVYFASILLEPGSCTGTNGHAMLQHWHGHMNVPPGSVIPKVAAAAVAACKLKLIGLGANWDNEAGFARSVTFHFEGGAWLKTQCYNDRWPDIAKVLNVATAPVPVMAGLGDAVAAVAPFVEDEQQRAMFFGEGQIMTHNPASVQPGQIGAVYEVPGLPGGKVFNVNLFKQCVPHMVTIDLTSYADKAYFFGGTEANPVRGVAMAMRS